MAVENAADVASCIVLEEGAFCLALDEPTERAIFENSTAMCLARIDVRWNDIGAWTAVFDVNQKSADGNVTDGDVMTLGTTNSLIRGDDRLVVVIGLDDVIVVDTKDALLVTDRANAQRVKQVVERLQSNGRDEVQSHRFRSRSWGGVEALRAAAGYKMDMLTVLPGASVLINGHGQGESFLSVVAGEGLYQDDHGSDDATLRLGNMITIDRDTQARLTNTTTGNLHAMLLSTSNGATLDLGANSALQESTNA